MEWTDWFNTYLRSSAKRWRDSDAQEMKRTPTERDEVTAIMQALYPLVLWPLERLDCLPKTNPTKRGNISGDQHGPAYGDLVDAWNAIRTWPADDVIASIHPETRNLNTPVSPAEVRAWSYQRVMDFAHTLVGGSVLKNPCDVIPGVEVGHEKSATVEETLQVMRHSLAHGAWFPVARDPSQPRILTDILFVNRDPSSGKGGMLAVSVDLLRACLSAFADWIEAHAMPSESIVSYTIGSALPPTGPSR